LLVVDAVAADLPLEGVMTIAMTKNVCVLVAVN
jgi:hypothetical protein